ncbi:A disintegrin and metalloproteinase with thrombospondin motifs adt-1-like isoform X2 [Procambarus clarkii]|uniref:A disintegrin and metalloproteinase with thrombospondin motifs adt-1-like isoform X2 n=1 Tax=Procambarus clarkii TaxID=6728 RepID=UPI0037437685
MMCRRAPSPAPLFYFFLCCCVFGLAQSDGAGGVLTTEELRKVFGAAKTVPKYSVFTPRVVGVSEAKRHARATAQHVGVGQGDTQETAQDTFLQFNALGRSFNFRLLPNSDLISPDFVVIGRHGDKADIQEVDIDQLDCYYQGVDESQGLYNTSIAVELCGQVRGVITSPTAEYVIEPLPEDVKRRRRRRRTVTQGQEDLTSYTHILYRKEDNAGYTVEAKASRARRSFLPASSSSGEEEGERLPTPRALLGSRSERRSYYDSYDHVVDSRMRSEWDTGGDDNYDGRSYGDGRERRGEDLYIETAVFVDRDLYRHMQDNFPTNTEDQVLRVVLAMVNAVQLLYNDDSLGHEVKFVLKRLEILYTDPPGLRRPNDIDTFLTNFCTWQRQENPPEDTHALHWDHALILTGLDVYTLTSSGKLNSQVVGLAPVAGMCTRSSSCTVNEGRHFESVYVMAHEIGHKSQQSSCLRDVSAPEGHQMDHEASSPPGQRFSADQQCMLKHGAGSHHADSQPLEEICQDLHCRRDHYTWTSHPALEGTSCGNHKWCKRGRCQENSEAPALSPSASLVSSASQGASGSVGGKWGAWSECRSACLYGVDGVLSSGSSGLALSERRCGSRACRGEYRYRLCSEVEECGAGQRRTLQDFADDTCRGRARNSASLTGLAARVPVEGLSQCEVECETTDREMEASGKSFPDGTVCQSASSLPAFCVAAVCTEFRCESNALYGADPLTCRPDVGTPDPHRPLGPSDYRPSATVAPSFSRPDFTPPHWGPWRPASTCRFSCLTPPARGIQLVSRKCQDRGCTGVNKNIQICTPASPDCEVLKSTFEYASEVCGRFKSEVDQLSGVGMQLASTKEDPDRSCTVACQDAGLDYRFYRVNGREGWFPFGTDCSKGRHSHTPSYCLNGKCLDFSSEGTPLRNTIYAEYEKSRSLDLEPIIERDFPRESRPMSSRGWHSWGRRRRHATPSSSSWRRRRDVSPSSHPISSTISDQLLLTLVDQINHTLSTRLRGGEQAHTRSSIDFKNPLFVDEVPSASDGVGGAVRKHLTVTLKANSFTLTPLNPPSSNTSDAASFDQEVVVGAREYRWLVSVSPCSVTCGTGLEEVVVSCMEVRRDVGASRLVEALEASLCSPAAPPALPGFRSCGGGGACPASSPHTPLDQTTVIGRWLLGLLNDIRASSSRRSNSSSSRSSNSTSNLNTRS